MAAPVKPWLIARTVYGMPWFVAAILSTAPGHVSWTPDEASALRLDGAAALDLHQAVSIREDAPCYVARDGCGTVWTHHTELRA